MAKGFNAKLLGREKLMRKLDAISPAINAEMATAEMEAATYVAGLMRGRAPTRTGQLRGSFEGKRLSEISADKKRKALGTKQTNDPNAVGIVADYYWLFLEYGTVKMLAQPFVMSTWAGARRKVKGMLTRATKKAIRKAVS